MSSSPASIFSYEAQSNDGQRLSGTLDAANMEAAMGRLQALQLRVVKLEPADGKPSRRRGLASGDFLAFNQQLAQLTRAGLPIERGLRLIASDLKRGACLAPSDRSPTNWNAACRWPRHLAITAAGFLGSMAA